MAPGPPATDAASEEALARRIGHDFTRPDLLGQALAHRSWCAEHGGRDSNERLEYLGDAVLGLVVAEDTYRRYPDLSDGSLSKVRASVVNAHVLAEVARGARHPRPPAPRQGRGHLGRPAQGLDPGRHHGGRDRRRLPRRRSRGRPTARGHPPGGPDRRRGGGAGRLRPQEPTPGGGRAPSGGACPATTVEGSGPDHARRYLATVYVADQRLGTGEGRSKKDAEQVGRPGGLRIVGSRERRGRCLSFLKSRPSGGTSRARSSAGRSR